ncbi:DmsC/YnfH family molybdoenzyme membrane anchor subunit [Adlercreutzia sp. ZJ176]|nr:DmsC/YnfH family molybdoenzyme membrane anchor subunit [Adlercreutzia sp. ZJ176]
MQEITLVLFTTVGPAGAVGFVVMALSALVRDVMGRKGAASVGVNASSATGMNEHAATAVVPDAFSRISRYLVIPLALAITGLVASATHLGTPANALFVLAGVGRSPLSNEVVAAVVFLALGGSFWIASFYEKLRPRAARAWLSVSIAAALAFVGFVAAAYSVETVPTWNMAYGPATLWLGGVSSGVMVGLFGIAVSKVSFKGSFERVCVLIAATCVLAEVVVLVAENAALSGVSTTAQEASALVPWLPAVIGVFAVLNACGVALAFRAAAGGRTLRERTSLAGAAAACALVACFAVRFSFYAMYMTVGL